MTPRKSRAGLLAILIPIVVFLILGALLAVGTFWYLSTMTALGIERDELKHYLDSSRVEVSHEKEEEFKGLAAEATRRAEGVKGTLYSLSSYPDLRGEHFEALFSLAGDEVEVADYAYDRRSGVMSFSATSQSVRRIPHFVQGLRECGYFSDVQYRGYVRSTSTSSGSPVIDPVTDITTIPTISIIEYRYEITCQLVSPSPALPAVEADEAAEGEPEGGGAQEGGS
jgi:hypothetical protein